MNTSQTELEKVALESMDVGTENRAKLKALFPSVFTETLNEKGRLVESIDFEKLRAELGTFSDLFEGRKERYGMDWPGKKECLKIIQQPSLATLKPCREESVNFDTTENLFVEGDNLEVLKLLQKSYYSKVKMIYIDPPYNTGKEFIYPDHYAESLDTYLAYAGLVDDKGKKFSTNTANEGRFHTKWLNMMYPRLYLARNLLREDGVIFISIDENELKNLQTICNEIFGEENCLAILSRRTKSGGGSAAHHFAIDNDYVVVYSKMKSALPPYVIPHDENYLKRYSHKDELGSYYWDTFERSYTQTKPYIITAPDGTTLTGKWFRSEDRFHEDYKNGEIRILKKSDGSWSVHFKQRLSDGRKIRSLLHENEFRSDQDDLISLDMEKYFDFPKPVFLLKHLLSGTKSSNNDIILDFFSGSSTTAHAILNLNNVDNGNRKFIMVQLPEPCHSDSEAFKAGFKTIADIGKERIRRVIHKIKQEVGTQANFDLGFKVLKLDKSNFKIWEPTSQITVNELLLKLEGHIPHIDSKASQEDILYELLLKSGYLPTAKVEKQQIAGKTVYSIGDGVLMICLESEITREFIEAVAATDPERFICLDHAFKGNDQLKTNAMHAFSSRRSGGNQDVFRTI